MPTSLGPSLQFDDLYIYHVCTTSGTFTPNFTGTVEVLVVAGGGGVSVGTFNAALANTNLAIGRLNTNLTGTNTAIRTLVADRLQVANANAKFATKAYAASNTYVKQILANTNAYIASVSAGGGGVSNATFNAALANTNIAIKDRLQVANANAYLKYVNTLQKPTI